MSQQCLVMFVFFLSVSKVFLAQQCDIANGNVFLCEWRIDVCVRDRECFNVLRISLHDRAPACMNVFVYKVAI